MFWQRFHCLGTTDKNCPSIISSLQSNRIWNPICSYIFWIVDEKLFASTCNRVLHDIRDFHSTKNVLKPNWLRFEYRPGLSTLHLQSCNQQTRQESLRITFLVEIVVWLRVFDHNGNLYDRFSNLFFAKEVRNEENKLLYNQEKSYHLFVIIHALNGHSAST